MSKTFKSVHGSKNAVEVTKQRGSVHIMAGNHDDSVGGCAVSNADAPALCLAILEAAGIEDDPNKSGTPLRMALAHLKGHVLIEQGKAEEAAALEKLTKRRVEVLGEISNGHLVNYSSAGRYVKNAVNRIIELEDKAQS